MITVCLKVAIGHTDHCLRPSAPQAEVNYLVVLGQLAAPGELADVPVDLTPSATTCLLRWVQREFSSREQPEPAPTRNTNFLRTFVSQLTRHHARPNNSDGITAAGLRHGRRDHLRDSRRNAIFVFWIDTPAINTTGDLMRQPAGRPVFHDPTFRVGAGPRSSGWKFAAARTASGLLLGPPHWTVATSGFGNDAGAVPASTALA